MNVSAPSFNLNRVEDVDPISTVSPTWEKRPKANIVKWLMGRSGKSTEDIAKCLGCTPSYLNNKLYRDSFSVDDMVVIAYVCGHTITFINNVSKEERSMYQIDIENYFGSSNPATLERIRSYERGLLSQKREKYEELKDQLEQMKEEYGFDD